MITVQPTPAGQTPINVADHQSSVDYKTIDAKHPAWEELKETYFNISVMYEGGSLIRKHAERFLLKRPKEDPTVYAHRVQLMTYENNLGTGLGWWQAEMFSAEPKIDLRPTDANGKPTEGTSLPADANAFYMQRFLPNCDRNGSSFLNTARDIFKNLLLYRQAFVLIDNPTTDTTYETLYDQQKAGALDPYLCVYSPAQIINWDVDDNGNFNWLVIYQRTTRTEFMKDPRVVERWSYYDRTQYRVYECEEEQQTAASTSPTGKRQVSLVNTGYHALYKQKRVPFEKIELPEGWWLSNRAYLPALEHLDTANVLRWSLRMAGLAVPVVFTDDDIASLTVAEYAYIKLPLAAKYEWTEPEGRSWQHLASRIVVLTEEIWRAMYLVGQARTTNATASQQSGVSKQQDMAPSHDVLDGMGAILRVGLQNILKLVGAARGDENISPDVTGFTFEDKLSAAELDVIETVTTLGVPSRTFEKAIDKLTVRTVLKGANDDILDTIFKEIDAGPTRAEQAQQQMEQELAARQNAVRQNITASNKDPAVSSQSD